MKQKLLDLLEQYVDKLVLVIIAIASLALLWFFVISNPYAEKVNGVSRGPGKIDAVIKKDAESLERRINGSATEPPPRHTDDSAGKYLAKMTSTVTINDKAAIQMANVGTGAIEDKRFYRKPSIPAVEGVDAEVIRTAVFVPTEKVDIAKPYQMVQTEVSDIDFVTVQASLDVKELHKNFRSSFLNPASAEYKDEELSVPIFAAVGLERQVLARDGQWSDWQVVNRPRIDKRREMFVVPEKAQDIDLGGIKVLLINFQEFEVQKDLLQPVAYDVAASNAEWMTPSCHKELVKLIEKQIKEAEKDGTKFQPGAGGAGNPYMGPGMGPGMGSGMGSGMAGTRPGRTPRRVRTRTGIRAGKDRTMQEIRGDFDFLKMTKDVDLSMMKEPLVFWAFDEDVKPLMSYRYRIRLGVFNPTAGKGWFSGSDDVFKDDVILWSEYSDVTEDIKIDPMIRLFPLEVAKRKKNTAKIQVSKFHDGKWRSEEFDIRVGESIGQLVEVEPDEKIIGKRPRAKVAEEIKTIDFSSGAILVDIVESKRSVSGGRPYQEILYTENGVDIKHLGISKRNWPKALSSIFKDVEAQKNIFVEIFEMRGAGRGMYPGMYPGMGPGEYGDTMMEGFREF